MNLEEIKTNLCYYDIRNPDNELDVLEMTEVEIKKKMADCYCDNCFYGRTKLANELLKYIENENSK